MSSASILIRLCAAPALSIAAYRLTIATAILLIGRPSWLFAGRVFLSLDRWVVASGLFLSLHFATWIRSLELTTVASSVLLVQTSPVFVALCSPFLLKERPSPRQWLGIGLAFSGTLAIAGLDFSTEPRALIGDVLALLGAIGGAGYWICGRVARRRLDTRDYVISVYGVSALVLLALAGATGNPLWGFSPRDLTFLFLIAIVPQGIGHTSFNWALRHLSATAVSVSALGEPVGATLLAWFILGEHVPLSNLAGASLVLAGLALVIWEEGRLQGTAARRPTERQGEG